MTALTTRRTTLSTKMKYQYKARKVNGRRIDEHRLVAIAHWGEEACRGKVVHHKNGIKTDNRIENLELEDRSLHSRHHMLGTHPSTATKKKLSESSKRFFLSHTQTSIKPIAQYTKDGNLIAVYESRTATSYYGYDKAHIKACCLGKRHSAHGYIWKYFEGDIKTVECEVRTRIQAISMGV